MPLTELIPFELPGLPGRPADGHKGTFGKVALIGGSVGMSGAICLSSAAALRSGSGLVTAIVPASIQSIVAGFEPSVMTTGLKDDPEHGLLAVSPEVTAGISSEKDAIGIGPGLGRGQAAEDFVRQLLQQAMCPLVLDADALNVAARGALLAERRKTDSCVVTPHIGEFARLCGRPIQEIERHRAQLAGEFAAAHRLIVVLKGPQTLVTDGRRIYLNTTGNSGMATGGTGDVLTGVITSLLGQGLPPMEASVLAVHAHGLAGDIAAELFTGRGMIASDLLSCLPKAWQQREKDSHGKPSF